MTINCPKCNEAMEQEENDPTTNVTGGYYCVACDIFIPEWEIDNEPDFDPRQ